MGSRQERILIIDDDPLYLDMITQGLRFSFPNHVILGADSGVKALSIIDACKPNLIITDLGMPGMDGFEVLLKIKERNLTIPTIVISAYGFTNPSDLARDFGTHLFLEKPVDFDTLCQAVSEILREPSQELSIVHGFRLTSFLQLMELDQKTGTVQIVAGDHEGVLRFEAGELTYAATGANAGNQALFEILGWPSPEIRISEACGDQAANVFESLSSLLLEGCHALDETKAA